MTRCKRQTDRIFCRQTQQTSKRPSEVTRTRPVEEQMSIGQIRKRFYGTDQIVVPYYVRTNENAEDVKKKMTYV